MNSQKIHFEKMKYVDLQEAKMAAVHQARLTGSRRAHVLSFGDGWEGGKRGEILPFISWFA